MEDAAKIALAYQRRAQEAEAILLALVLDRSAGNPAWADAERLVGALDAAAAEPRQRGIGEAEFGDYRPPG